jgi:hypothetical protein
LKKYLAHPSVEWVIVCYQLMTYSLYSGASHDPHAPVILDIAGTRLDRRDRQRLAHPLTGGMILFARNWQTARSSVPSCAPRSRRVRRTC